MSDEEITVDEVQRLAEAYAITDPNGFTVKALRWAVEQYDRAEQAILDYDKYYSFAENEGMLDSL